MNKKLTFGHIFLLNQLVTTMVLIAVLGIYGTHLYRSEQDDIRERMEVPLLRELEKLNSEFAAVESNVYALKSIADLYDVIPKANRTEKFRNFAATTIAPHTMQYNSYLVFGRDYSQKYFSKKSYVHVIYRNDSLVQTARYDDPSTFNSEVFFNSQFESDSNAIWWHNNKKGPGIHYSDFYFDKGYMEKVMYSTTTGIYENEKLKAVVGIDTLVEEISRRLLEVQLGKTGGLLIVDEHGHAILPLLTKDLAFIGHRFVRATSPEEFARIPRLSEKAFDVGTEKLSEFQGMDDQTYLTSSRPIKGRPWNLIIYQEQAEAFSGLYVRLFLFVFLALTTYLVFTIMVWVTGRYVIKRDALALADLKEAKEKAEIATRVKSSFLSTMSHEIRTPLNAMLGSAELLSETPLNPEQKELLQSLEGSGETLLGMLNNILDFSKFESGRMQLEKREFLLSDLVRDVEYLVTPGVRRKGLDFILSAPTFDRWIVGDSLRLKQVLINLLGNAIKFTDRGSIQLIIEVRPTDHESYEDIHFEVKDTGVGIATENLRKIFDEFGQADSSVTRRYGGTGLGLSISQKIVNLMGGELRCQSQQHVGSQFYFSAVFQSRKAEAWSLQIANDLSQSSQRQAQSSLESSIKILIVDDMEENHSLLKAYLRSFKSFVIDSAYDGYQCLEMWKETSYDIVFMDVQMPRLSGLDAIRKLRQIELAKGLPRTPIVVISANSFKDDIEKSLAAGADEHCGKPIRKQTVLKMIEKYCAYKKAADDSAAE